MKATYEELESRCAALAAENALLKKSEPAPVVPAKWTIADAVKFCKKTGRQDAGSAMDAWNACCTAMLQGKAEPVSNRDELNYLVITDGWISCSERMPDETTEPDGGATGYLVLYADGKVPNGGFNVGVWNVTYLRRWWRGFVTHWMPLPAAPQQEVK